MNLLVMPKEEIFDFFYQNMNNTSTIVYGLLVVFFLPFDVYAQITPDPSLGSESSIVIRQNQRDLIEGGAVRENNLFHSFSEFNINRGQQVYFANPDGITSILTRVTGNNVSEILGILGVNGTANLFLLNPNGIIFGENASLDINGSFLATTADSYIFNNGFEYSASNPETPPLLTISMPLGLQFSSNPAAIEVQGKGNNLILNPLTFEFLLSNFRPKGLEVLSGNTLGLVGGEIKLTGGNLTALQGRIELGSVAEATNVFLNPTEDGFTFDYQNITNFDDINLTDLASIDVSGNGGGNIQLQGNNINLLDNSAIISSTTGQKNGGTVKISAVDTLNIFGDEEALIPSGVFNQVQATATGNGSNLHIEANQLEISDNALLNSSVAGAGDGGEVYIQVEELILNDSPVVDTSSLLFFPTGIFSLASVGETVTGNSSNLTIEAERIKITNGALIATATFSAGDSGDINIKTDSLELSGTGLIPLLSNDGTPFPSGIFTTVAVPLVTGNGGNITINTSSLQIADGGQIRSGTFGLGDSGDISIKSQEISIRDISFFLDTNVSSGIFASSGLGILTGETQQTTGNGGSITIDTDNLTLTEGGQIGTGTSSTGNSGDLILQAQDINIIGQSFSSLNETLTGFVDTSGLFTSVVRADALGNGGDIVVETDNLQIFNGGAIAANVFGQGSGGDIQIDANNVNISDSFVVSDIRSGITTTVEATGTGDAGNIEISTDNLNLTSGGSIAASAIGDGNAGDINLQGINLNLEGMSSEANLKSQIAAFSVSDSDAGTIDIFMQNVTLSDRATISVSNLGNGNSGNLNLNSQNLNLDHEASLEAQVNTGNQGNINLITDNIFLEDQSKITSQATGTATGGNIFIENRDNLVLQESSQITADALQGNGGNINITTRGFFVSADSLISASSEFGLDGTVEIDILNQGYQQTIEAGNYDFIAISKLINNRCFASQLPQQSSFTYIGRGGTPINPDTRIDQDYNLAKANDVGSEIVEANALSYNDRGKLQLISLSSLSNTINYLNSEPSNRCQ